MVASVSAAPSRSASRSSRSPRSTCAPFASRLVAEASERARPRTSYPLASSSSVTADPIHPDAPVIKPRMLLFSVCSPPFGQAVMSEPVIGSACHCTPYVSVCHHLFDDEYDRSMVRWQPAARERLQKASLELFAA